MISYCQIYEPRRSDLNCLYKYGRASLLRLASACTEIKFRIATCIYVAKGLRNIRFFSNKEAKGNFLLYAQLLCRRGELYKRLRTEGLAVGRYYNPILIALTPFRSASGA